MLNEWLWIPSAILTLGLLVLSYKLFGRVGLYAWIAMASVVANIQVTQQIVIGGYIFTLGNIVYGSLYLATDILNEKHGRAAARKGVWLGFLILIVSTVLMQYALLYEPFEEALFMHESFEALFSMLPLITLGSLAAYLVSQLFDV
ncbi:MAG: queuosine precursor transporter, partial [Exiguobacterium sp.]